MRIGYGYRSMLASKHFTVTRTLLAYISCRYDNEMLMPEVGPKQPESNKKSPGRRYFRLNLPSPAELLGAKAKHIDCVSCFSTSNAGKGKWWLVSAIPVWKKRIAWSQRIHVHGSPGPSLTNYRSL
jgi:hypothetical protein